MPAAQRFSGTHPDAGRDADLQRRDVLGYEHLEAGVHVRRGRAVRLRGGSCGRVARAAARARGRVRARGPRAAVDVLVDQAQDAGDGGHDVQNVKDADAHHALAQPVRGPRPVPSSHHISDPEQRDDVGRPHRGAQHQVHHRRDQHHVSRGRVVAPNGHRTDTGQDVTYIKRVWDFLTRTTALAYTYYR